MLKRTKEQYPDRIAETYMKYLKAGMELERNNEIHGFWIRQASSSHIPQVLSIQNVESSCWIPFLSNEYLKVKTKKRQALLR